MSWALPGEYVDRASDHLFDDNGALVAVEAELDLRSGDDAEDEDPGITEVELLLEMANEARAAAQFFEKVANECVRRVKDGA